jgi:DNA-binding MarR family transcriptional regulator
VGQETKLSAGDICQLVDVVSKVATEGQCTASEAIRRIASIASPKPPKKRDRGVLAHFVTRLRKLRLRRNELIGAPLFRDPAWDMLLELFAAHETGRKVTVSSLCYASGVPPTTALRQIQRLEAHKLVTRSGDGSDNRRCYIEPTPELIANMAMMAAMFADHCEVLDVGGSYASDAAD